MEKKAEKMKNDLEKEILELLQENQYLSIDSLSSKLYLSSSTVRRKLTSLQQKGLITRTHGGAKLNENNNFFPSFIYFTHKTHKTECAQFTFSGLLQTLVLH